MPARGAQDPPGRPGLRKTRAWGGEVGSKLVGSSPTRASPHRSPQQPLGRRTQGGRRNPWAHNAELALESHPTGSRGAHGLLYGLAPTHGVATTHSQIGPPKLMRSPRFVRSSDPTASSRHAGPPKPVASREPAPPPQRMSRPKLKASPKPWARRSPRGPGATCLVPGVHKVVGAYCKQ